MARRVVRLHGYSVGRGGVLPLPYEIGIKQTTRRQCTVIYGLEHKPDLDYDQAARAIGYAVMHALGCEGVIELDLPRR